MTELPPEPGTKGEHHANVGIPGPAEERPDNEPDEPTEINDDEEV